MRTPTSRSGRRLPAWPLLIAVMALACGGGGGDASADSAGLDSAASAAAKAAGLTVEEMKYGIGGRRDLELGEIDRNLFDRGQEIFTTKCSACHKLGERYVGPPLGGVTERREPEYVMNMILNTDEMVARHPEVKKLLAEYYTPMPDQQLSEEDARAVLEYLRAAPVPSPEDEDEDSTLDDET